MDDKETPYKVSALKWRPQTFKEIVGQDHVCATLQNALRSGRVAHAYLFAGTRGVGKTTTARVLAKALNCYQGPTPEPCGACASCVEIREGRAIDVVEIDGASNRGIDQVRELRERVRYAPARDRYKIYIIDEVHMLTEPAFNALLKTLEEPPQHVVFVFATTDPRKIPITILSRCQRFEFKRISADRIARQLSSISSQEGMKISESQLEMIAACSDGSMRDAESLLDQVVAYSGGEVTDEAIATVLGLVPRDVLCSFAERVAERDAAGLLALVHDLVQYGHDLASFSTELLRWFRSILVFKISGDSSFLTDMPASYIEAVEQLSSRFSLEHLQQHCSLLCQTCEEIKRSSHPRYLLEVAAVRLTCVPSVVSLADVLEKLRRLERGPGTFAAEIGTTQTTLDYASGPAPENPTSTKPVQVPAPSGEGEVMKAVLDAVSQRSPLAGSILANAQAIKHEGSKLVIEFPESNRSSMNLIKERSRMELIQQVVQEVLGKGTRAVVVCSGERTASPTGDAPRNSLQNDVGTERRKDIIQSAIDLFKGTLVTE